MMRARVVGCCCLLLAGLAWSAPTRAQTSPPPSVLALPTQQRSKTPAPASKPPQAAPTSPVSQVAPFSSPPLPVPPVAPYVPSAIAPATPAPLHKLKKPTPVVAAPAHVHAQRPPGAAPAASAKPAPSAPPPTAAPPPVAAVPAVAAPAVASAAEPSPRPAETKGSVTNLPLPRWAALRADEVNMRVGPGMNFPIDWQYHRRDLPVRILRELDVWRLIEDQDGTKGWVHSATLAGHRGFIVTNYEATLRASAADESAAVARLKPGVVGRVRRCDAGADWCEVQVADYKGWLRRTQFYGTDPGEAVGN
jgi:SH3-like domain-containing protein